jgi:sulfate adenylyltransferase
MLPRNDSMSAPNEPHGGVLRELLVPEAEREVLRRDALLLPSWELTERQLCDLELLMNGAFSPLEGFMARVDYEQVVGNMRLASGLLWPMPLTLDISEEVAGKLDPGGKLVLRDPEGTPLALMDVSDVWRPDRQAEAHHVYGTVDPVHPGVDTIVNRSQPMYVGGRVRGIEAPQHFDFVAWRLSPRELRDRLAQLGWKRVVAFQTRNPMHRAHVEMTLSAARAAQANILLHPVVGLTKPGDIDHYSRVRSYQKVLGRYPEGIAVMSLLPLSMRMAGPREAIWHAIVRKNYGCSHFVVGRDHAGPGKDGDGREFYPAYAAQELAVAHQAELGIKILPFPEIVYVENRATYAPANEVADGERVLTISGTEFRRRLREGLEIPAWFSWPEVVEELRRSHVPRNRQGVTVFFTGLSGAGKSTIAKALLARLLEIGGRSVTLLDGDVVRSRLSSELGFSRAHRDLNILRIGFVAAEITKHGGIALCAPIAPYAAARAEVRRMVSNHGGFFEIHVATPLDVCERRDRKGLYAKARAGLIKEFTGISDAYEVPVRPELVVDTRDFSPLEAVAAIMARLETEGFVGR